MENPAGGESHKIVWPSTPGVLYELQQSSNLTSWTVVDGFPRQAAGMSDQHAFQMEGDRLFFRVREIGAVPSGFAFVPAGSYSRGDHMNDPESWMARSRPVHQVHVSGFFVAQTPLTYGEWRDVYDWAVANGYSFDNPGQRGSDSDFQGLPPTPDNDLHPVVRINWYDTVKWCNASSEMNGLTPVYYTDDGRTMIYRTGQHDVHRDHVDWTANGYRLLTSAEWEKAARGGLEENRWFWGDDEIDGSRANFRDSSEVNGTTQVGSFPPNAFELYDVAGNVWEFCWDWFQDNWYSEPGASLPDTRGPDSGIHRSARGGSWNFAPEYGRVGYFGGTLPSNRGNSWGFRVARSH